METSIIIAGFGGQGVLFAGQLLAYAALEAGREVSWIPSYGPEMRGGTAHCTVIIADEPIGSPLVRNPDCVVAMNSPSVDKYEPLVKSGGVLLADSTLLQRPFARSDLRACAIPAIPIAVRCGDQRLANLAMLGGLLALQPFLAPAAVEAVLRARLPVRHHRLLEPNVAAFREGAAIVARAGA